MNELYIPVIVLKSGSCTTDLYFAGTKEDLIDALDDYTFIKFFYKDDKDRREAETLVRADDIDVIEFDSPDEIEEAIRDAKEDGLKVIDLTNVLQKISEKPDAINIERDFPVRNALKNLKTSWVTDATVVGDKLIRTIDSQLTHDQKEAEKLFNTLIYVVMDAADAIKFFLSAYDKEVHDEIIAKYVNDAAYDWMRSLRFDCDVILNTLKKAECRDFVMDDIFTTALDAIEADANN